LLLVGCCPAGAAVASDGPYSKQGNGFVSALAAPDPSARARAAEGLGYLRFHPAEDALLASMTDENGRVRRAAALALGWCGSRSALPALLAALEDGDWLVRQSAWVALTNLTGIELPFDALENPAARARKADAWRGWIAALPAQGLPADLLAMLASEDHHQVERAARAAGALGADAAAVAHITRAIEPWQRIPDEKDEPAKWRVQAALRALGRSRQPDALPVLVAFLQHEQWARYAAEALGDFGGEEAAAALLRAFPRYARPANAEIIRSTTHNPPHTHRADQTGFDSRDRILAAPYAILMALTRIPFSQPENLALLGENAALIAAQTPLDIDGLIVYEEEPYQQILHHLLERAGTRRTLVELAFATLGSLARYHETHARPSRRHRPADPRRRFCIEPAPRSLPRSRRRAPPGRPARSRQPLGAHQCRTHPPFYGCPRHRRCHRRPLARIAPGGRFRRIQCPYFAQAQGQDEFNDPTPRYREAFIMALGGMKAAAHVPLLTTLLNDERNALGIRHRAALALDEIGTPDASKPCAVPNSITPTTACAPPPAKRSGGATLIPLPAQIRPPPRHPSSARRTYRLPPPASSSSRATPSRKTRSKWTVGGRPT
jgi:HEAT repeat protein